MEDLLGKRIKLKCHSCGGVVVTRDVVAVHDAACGTVLICMTLEPRTWAVYVVPLVLGLGGRKIYLKDQIWLAGLETRQSDFDSAAVAVITDIYKDWPSLVNDPPDTENGSVGTMVYHLITA